MYYIQSRINHMAETAYAADPALTLRNKQATSKRQKVNGLAIA